MNMAGERQKIFGGRLSEGRRARGFTQEELANRLGVTPQALSKWERGASFPDLEMFAEICEQLGTGADYLLGVGGRGITENGDEKAREEVLERLRSSLEPLELVFGMEVVPLFLDNGFVPKIAGLRRELAAEGILLPVMRLRDHSRLRPKEFMILASSNVLYAETLEEIGGEKLDYIMGKLGETVRERYDEILNADILRQLVDNLKIRYPGLIQGVVPERISYGLLLDVTRELIKRGDSPRYLPRVIEMMEHELREGGVCSAAELAERVGRSLERRDNLDVYLHERAEKL